MSLILVIEQEAPYAERIKGALTAEGWTVEVVDGREAAVAAAANGAPDLVLVSTAAPGADEVLRSFARAHGGPGAMALTAAGAATPAGADGALSKPFTDEQLRVSVRRCLSRGQKAAAEAAAARAASAGAQLTSQDLFGDLLAEVEEEALRAARPAPARPEPDIDKQLQQTLSGVLDASARPAARPASAAPATPHSDPAPQPTPIAPAVAAPTTAAASASPPVAAPPPPAPKPAQPSRPAAAARARAADAASGEIDVLLSQTLSGLGVATRPRRAAPHPAAAPKAEMPPAAVPAAAHEEPPGAQAVVVETPEAEPPKLEPAAAAAVPPEPPRRERGRRPAEVPPPVVVFSPVPDLPPPTGGFATVRVETARPVPPDQFGQYSLLDRVAVGGMAEVWKARMKGVEGFQKTVAIKKILPHLTDSVDFVTMFIDEAKLAAQLNHPNIIHIYDLGKLEDDYYIAMEYVEGRDLRSILNTARRREQPLPTGLALLIAARLASALDYAHRKRDFDNRELGLVHRDVSPQNVLISYEGDIKLCDFGIVKAVAKASKTQMGALKGKLQYMSPEQAWGRVVDARSDIFSLGAVLFEMLTGRRLFAGESEISVLEAVRECRVQSVREVEPGTSEAVDAIVRRALAKDPDDRYQTAGEMQKELESVLYTFKPTPSQEELGAHMRRLFSEELGETGATDGKAVGSAASVPSPGAEVPAVAPVGGLQEGGEGGRKRPWLVPVAAVLVLGVVGVVFWLTRGGFAPTGAADRAAAAAAPAAAPAPAASAPVVPAPTPLPAAAPADTAEMQRLVQQQLQAKEEQLKQQLEEQRRQIAAQLKSEPAPSAASSLKPSPTQVAAVTLPQPSTAPTQIVEEPPAAPPEAETAAAEVASAVPEPSAAPAPIAAVPVAPPPPPKPAINEGDLVEPGTPGLTPPAFVSVEKPEYPALAKRFGVQGVVVVSVLVNERGAVEQARIVKGVAQKVGINEAALAAARSARYRPATVGGVRVKTWANLSIPFKL